jgi:hypothetical protein
MTAYQPNLATQNWIERQVGDLPPRWKKKLVNRWHSEVPGGRNFDDKVGHHPEFSANRHLAVWAERLGDSRLPLDASYETICRAADELANRASELAKVFHDMKALRAAMNRLAHGQDVKPPRAWDELKQKGVKDAPAVARMASPEWWRPKLGKVHARNIEGAAIDLGYVNRASDCYVSNESVKRRAQQHERTIAIMENTILTNELGQEYTLAELAAKGPANKAVRRIELMTRISGFERIALELGHVGLFMTMTAPGRMHKWLTVKGDKTRVYQNKRYDGTLPDAAQQRHGEVWARIRAKCDRYGIKFYGFRIAEPNHDGTPHWHLLVFLDPAFRGDPGRDAIRRFCAIVRRYALGQGERNTERKAQAKAFERLPHRTGQQAQAAHALKMHRWDVTDRQLQNTEVGAKAHRVDFKPIDTGRGSAAGYIAKYVAKNIDGFKLEKDLYGNDAATASQRVEAWAATWRIRQFQQVGGPPIGPWRELRRVQELPGGAPQHLIDAHYAVNKITNMEAGTVKPVSWAHYTKAQGGVFCGRKARIKVSKTQPEGTNRYGEAAAQRPIGVETVSIEQYTPAHMAHMGGQATRFVHWIVESDRHTWTVEMRKPGTARAPVPVPDSYPAASRPWTCVNNCTQDDKPPALQVNFLSGRQGENWQKTESWADEKAYCTSQ